VSVLRFVGPVLLSGTAACAGGAGPASPPVRLVEWERGIALQSREDPATALYLWFYEWNMFDAVKAGEHTNGSFRHPRTVAEDGRSAEIRADEMGLRLEARAAADGAELVLTARNRSDHDWPELAGIIPCFSPGMDKSGGPATPEFANEKTFFPGPRGLEPLVRRTIHWNRAFRSKVDARATGGRFAWTDKWPSAEPDSEAGLIVRESNDGRWAAGIAWSQWLSVQGHNPWRCMHLCARVGPLKPGESRTLRGRLYLLRGSAEDVLARYRRDFGPG